MKNSTSGSVKFSRLNDFGSSKTFYIRLLQRDGTSEDRLLDKRRSSHATN